MRFLGGLLLLAASTAAQTLKKCNADNCLRAIRASAFPTRPGTADCISYFRTTVTPATVTSYIPVTYYTNTVVVEATTTTTVEPPILAKRDVTFRPTAIPAYASWCSGSVRYSSACSCIGITPEVVTLSTPTTFIVQTASLETTTTTVAATATATSFLMQIQDGSEAGSFVGGNEVDPDFYLLAPIDSIESAFVFTLKPDGSITGNGYPLGTYDSGVEISWIAAVDSSYTPLQCTINSSNEISCVSPPYVEWGLYAGDYLFELGKPGADWAAYAGEGPLTVKAVPVP